MRAPPIGVVLWIRSDDAKEAVCFAGNPSGEINSATQREKIPQAIKLEWRAIGAHERFDESSRHRIVNVNEAITEIADPKMTSHLSKSPWGIEIPVCDQASEEGAAGVEHIDKAKAGPGNI